MKTIFSFLEKQSDRRIFIGGVGLTGLAGVIDYIIGPEISSAIFFVVPIALATWFGSRRNGMVVVAISGLVWLLGERISGPAYHQTAAIYWNTLVRLSLFGLIAWLMSAFREKLREEELLAKTDGMTGVLNNRAFYESAEAELQRFNRFGRPFTIAYIDLDNFKYVNDQYGHSTGDALLKAVAEEIKGNVRSVDYVARLGGDEFAVLLSETGPQTSVQAVSKIRQRLSDRMMASQWPVTFSIGMVTYTAVPRNRFEMVTMADKLMYRIKKAGKDGTVHAIWSGNQEDLERAKIIFVKEKRSVTS